MHPLNSYRSKAAGLPDLINYAFSVDNGIVQGKDGSLIAGFTYRGADSGSSSNSELNYLTTQVNSVLMRFGSGWALWVDAVRIPSPGYPDANLSHFPDPVSRMIEAERREMFEHEGSHFETEYTIVLQFMPPSHRAAKFGEMIYDDDSYEGSSPGNKILADFKRKLEDFEDGISRLLNPKRMGIFTVGKGAEAFESDQLVNYLHFTMTGEALTLRIPSCPMYMDSWLGYENMWPGETPKYGDKYIACVSIDGFPSFSHPGILTMFENLPIAYRWSSRFIFMEDYQAVSALDKYRKGWEQSVTSIASKLVRSAKAVVNKDSLSMKNEVEQAMSDARSGLVTYGYYTTVVVLMSKDKGLLLENARYVRKLINGKGFHARIEETNTVETWLGTLPGHTVPNVRRPLMHTLNLAELLPLSGIWPGLKENPCSFYPDNSPPLMRTVTTGSTPFRLNVHVSRTGHVLIFGPTEAGKSFLLNMLEVQAMRYRSRPRPDGSTVPATITILDKGWSAYALCKAVGGQHYAIGSDDSSVLALCPLSDIDTDSGMLWASEWLGNCYQLQTETPLDPDQKNEVRRALQRLKEKPRGERSLYDFVQTVQKKEIRQALEHYTIDGAMGHLLDGRDDLLNMSNYTVFEMDELMAMGDKNALPVLLYLFRRFEKTLTGQPAFLVLDEAWIMLGHPIFREKIREWLKELRKKNCSVIMATQSLSDAVHSGIMNTLIEQCPTQILLPNSAADVHGVTGIPGPADYYAMFGMGGEEINHLKNARYRLDYYYRSPLGRRWFQLGVGPVAMAFVGVSDKDSIRDVKACEAAYGADWPIQWLKQKGVNYAKYLD